MFDFADRFNKLNLTDEEVAIFSAIVLLSPGNKDFNLLSHWKLDILGKNLGKNTNHAEYFNALCILCKSWVHSM